MYSITGWVILTLIQHGTPEQVARWVPPALSQDVIWCQLFSEPAAGSDAAGVRTRASRVEGGWLLNGQKVWTSGGHVARHGFATVRTDPEAPKHAGITTMVIDMHAPGVEVRPLRMTTGCEEFNEVFLTDVFVPDEDVVGPVDGGWQVARATLGNESVSIGAGQGGGDMGPTPDLLIDRFRRPPARLAGGEARIGSYIAHLEAMQILNLRSVHRAVSRRRAGRRGQRDQAGAVGAGAGGCGHPGCLERTADRHDGGRGRASAACWCWAAARCRSPAAPRRSSATRSANDCSGSLAIR